MEDGTVAYPCPMVFYPREYFEKLYPTQMNHDEQALDLLKQLLDAWVNGVDGDAVADIMDRITLFLENHQRDTYGQGVSSVRYCGHARCTEQNNCDMDPGDCNEPGYGAGV